MRGLTAGPTIRYLVGMDEPAKAPVNLIALRDRREQVIAALTDHFAADVLDVDEFDARVDAAHQATSIAALDKLVADLAPVTTHVPTTALVVHDNPARPETKGLTAIMGGFERQGPWVVPKRLRTRVFWGGGVLDFRDADFGPGVTEMHVFCMMGGLQIIVPPQLAVDVEVTSIMGGVDQRHAPMAPDPGRAILRITGTVVMGGLDIETRLPGESARQARKRAKGERKARERALDAGATRQLPPGKRE
jgi:hypothetical protein